MKTNLLFRKLFGNPRSFFTAALLTLAMLFMAFGAKAQIYYVTTDGTGSSAGANDALAKINKDGSSNTVIKSSLQNAPTLMAADLANNRVFVVEAFNKTVAPTSFDNAINVYSTTDGSLQKNIVINNTSNMPILGIKYDAASGFIYYLTSDGVAGTTSGNDAIWKIKPDGSSGSLVIGSVTGAPVALAIDIADNRAYVFDHNISTNTLRVVNLSDNSITSVSYGTVQVISMDFDVVAQKLYYLSSDGSASTNGANDAFGSANADGTSPTSILGTIAKSPGAMALDAGNKKAYIFEGTAIITPRQIDVIDYSGSPATESSFSQSFSVPITGMIVASRASLTTAAVGTVTSSSAVLGGNISSSDVTVTERGVVYSSSNTTPTTSDSKAINGSGTGAFSATVGSLGGSTTYYARAYATSSAGTAYGAVVSFTTPAANTTINSITGTTPSPATATNASTVTYTVTFGASVAGLSASNFSLAGTATNASINSVSASPASTYTVVVNTGNVSGTLTLKLANATGLTPGISTSLPFTGDTYTVDKTAPTVSSITANTPSNAATTNVTSVTYNVNFSESVSNVDATDFTFTNVSGATGSVTGISGSGSSYTLTVTGISGDGQARLDLKSSGTGITDAVGNAISGGYTSGAVYTFDHTAPTVVTTLSDPDPIKETALDFQAVFSEPVTGVDASDFTLTTSAGITYVAGGLTPINATTYNLSFNTVVGNGTAHLDLNGSGTGITDAAGNVPAAYVSTNIYHLDQTAPTITIGAPSVSTTLTGPVTYSVTYADANFSGSSLTLANITLNSTGTATGTVGLSGSGTSYTVTISNTGGLGSLGFTIAAGTAHDSANNLAPAATSTTFNVTQTSVTQLVRNSANPTKATTVNYLLTFADAVTGLSASNFSIAHTGTIAGATVGTISGSGTTYSVDVNYTSGEGDITLSLANATGLSPGVNSLPVTGQTFTIDLTPPVVTSVFAPADGTYGIGGTLLFTAAFNEPVTVSTAGGTPYIGVTLNTGGTVHANYSSGSTSTQLVFSYTVASGDLDADGVTVGSSINLSGGTISDFAGNSATSLPLSNVGSTANVFVDGVAPVISSLTGTTPSPATPTKATSVAYTATFSEPVTGVNTSAFTVTTTSGNATGSVGSVVAIDGSNYTVNVIGITGDGGLRLDLNSGAAIFDNNSNQASAGFTTGDVYTIDNTAPSALAVTFTSNHAGNANVAVAGDVVALKFQGNETLQSGTVTIAGHSVSATYLGSGNQWEADYTMASGDAFGRIPFTLQLNDLAGNTSTSITDVSASIDVEFPSLTSITLSSGTLTPSFPGGTNFTASVSFATTGITVTPTSVDGSAALAVNGTAVASGSPSANILLAVGPNTITVTSTNGTTQTYTIIVTRAASPNANLAHLVVSAGTLSPAFTKLTTDYTLSVPNATSTLQITPTANLNATITVNGVAVTSGTASSSIPLVIGTTFIKTIVTSQSGIVKTYKITVTRPKSSNADLASLTPSVGTLDPVFDPATTTYAVSVSNRTPSIRFVPVTSDATASITVNGSPVPSGVTSGNIALSLGDNVIPVAVTAQDGTVKTYNTTVTRVLSPEANLSDLSTSVGTISPAFDLTIIDYTVYVGNAVSTITVTPVTRGPAATVMVNGVAVASGDPSGDIALAEGFNLIKTVIIAADGTQKTYRITAIRASTTTNLVLNKGTLSPAFDTNITDYTAAVDNSVTSVRLTPMLSGVGATATVNGTAVASNSPSAGIPLTAGPNTITTVITAPDGLSSKTYTITLTRALSSNANLASLSMTNGELVPNFSTGTTAYTSTVGNTVATVTVTPVTADATAAITVNDVAVTSGSASGDIALTVGYNLISTKVTAQDGTIRTYNIAVTRAADMGPTNALYQPSGVIKPAEQASIVDDGLKVHQGISPNGDGMNDFLVIDGIAAYPDNTLSIMDRSGQLIFETNGYDNASKAFDGHSNKNGKLQQAGTYFYSLQYKVGNATKHKTGYIILKY